MRWFIVALELNLMGSYSKSGDLLFQISGDLPKSSFRSEGRLAIDIMEKKVVWKLNKVMFPNGFVVSDGRGLLSAIFCFHPTLSAIGSTLEIGDKNISKNDKVVKVSTNLEIPEEIEELLSNQWMLPKIEWVRCGETLHDSLVTGKNPSQPLAYGGGLDSGAAAAMFGEFTTPYHIVTLDTEVREGTNQILQRYNGCLCESNLKLLYSIPGFPHWCCPYIPALIAGSTTCSTGTIIESQFLRDEKEYIDSRGNLWLTAMKMTGLIPTPIYFHSEFTNSKIVTSVGLQKAVAGNCVDEWGITKKSLRKAILLAPFDESYLAVIERLESEGIVLNPKSTYDEDAKMLSSITLAASLISNKGGSKSLKNLSSIKSFRENPWATKAHPEGLEEIPQDIKTSINKTRKKLGIKIMNKKELRSLRNYDYEKIWKTM